MYDRIQCQTSARGLRIALVVSQYHQAITGALQTGAIDRFRKDGGVETDLLIVPAAGSFELTVLCRAVAVNRRPDAILAIGCIITGETTHDQHLAEALVHGLTQTTVQTGVPITFGVLTCQSLDQAAARAGGAMGNKGEEAMVAAIQTARTIRELTMSGAPVEHR